MNIVRHLRHKFFLLRKRVRLRLTRPLFQHSFYRSLEYRKWYWRRLVQEKGLADEVFPEFGKLTSRKVATDAGVAPVPLIEGPVKLEDLDLSSYGENFVIKPDWGASSVGVFVLTRRGEDRYYESISKKEMSQDSIRECLGHLLRPGKRGRPDRLLVESSLAIDGARPREWKLFTFHGKVGLIQGMSRDGTEIRIRLFDADGTDIGALRGDHPFDAAIAPPMRMADLVDAAERISRQIPTGFIRVDFFEVEDGTFHFGELRLIPGGDLFFRDGWDRQLGRLWDDANVQILASGRPLIP